MPQRRKPQEEEHPPRAPTQPPRQHQSPSSAVATREGIVALVHERLDAQHYPDEVLAPFAAATRGEAAMLLMREGECRRVLAAMAAEGLPALLLKGSALAYWAYAEPHLRKCVDIDLLLRSRAEVDRATSALATLGYQLRERTVPGDLISYELTCIRRASVGARVDLDLHWRLVNAPLYAERLQPDELWRDAIALPRLGLLLAVHHPQQRALARTRGADEEHELTLGDVEVRVLQRGDLAAVALRDVLESDHRCFSAGVEGTRPARKFRNVTAIILPRGVASGGNPP